MGKWINYEHLESTLTIEELFEIANAIADKENQGRRFAAALQGVNLGDNGGDMVDINELHIGEDAAFNDIVDLNGAKAYKEGFGIGMGLGFEEV